MAEAVMSADAAFLAAGPVAARRYAIGYAAPDGSECMVGLPDALSVAFETVSPVRSFVRYRGQRSNTGLWWSASNGGHVGFESWLERDHLMLLDFATPPSRQHDYEPCKTARTPSTESIAAANRRTRTSPSATSMDGDRSQYAPTSSAYGFRSRASYTNTYIGKPGASVSPQPSLDGPPSAAHAERHQ